jgi:hypothetical protein
MAPPVIPNSVCGSSVTGRVWYSGPGGLLVEKEKQAKMTEEVEDSGGPFDFFSS